MKTAWLIVSGIATLIGFVVMGIVLLSTTITLIGILVGQWLYLVLVAALLGIVLASLSDHIRPRKRHQPRGVQ